MTGARHHSRAIWRILLILLLSAAVAAVRVPTLPLRWISPALDRRVLETLIRTWGVVAAAILKLSCTVEGEVPRVPTLLVSNHLSYLDIVVFTRTWGGAFVAKSEVARWPGVNLLAPMAGTVFVDRKRKRDLLRVIDAMVSHLRTGRSVLFFPEATSSPGAEVLPFHSSLFEAAQRSGADVVAATLRYETDGADAARAVCWWGGMTFPDHAYALLGLPGIRSTLRFGSERLRAPDRKALARAARQEVASLFEASEGSERFAARVRPVVGTKRPDLASITR